MSENEKTITELLVELPLPRGDLSVTQVEPHLPRGLEVFVEGGRE